MIRNDSTEEVALTECLENTDRAGEYTESIRNKSGPEGGQERHREILALFWKHVDFENNLIQVEQSFKFKIETLGLPKWGKVQATRLADEGQQPEKIRAALGWANEATQAGYTHWGDTDLSGQAAIIDGLLSKSGVS